MHDARNLRFYPKAKFIMILGMIATLSHVGFWDPSSNVILNVVSIVFGMATMAIVFYGFYKRVNVAKYMLYVMALFSIFSLVMLVQMGQMAQIAIGVTCGVLLLSLLILNLFRAEARDFFSTEGSATWLKVLYGIVFLAVTGTTGAAIVMQTKLKAESEKEALAMQETLVMEGTPNEVAVTTCKEKYAESTKDLTPEQLNSFCTCVALNLDNVVKNMAPEEAGFTQLLSKYMAIGDACMKKIKK